MSLLDRMTYFVKSGLALVLIPFFFACDDPSELGLEVDGTSNNIKLEFIDFTLPISTVYIDSLRTEDQNNILFGSFEDSISGRITATGYTMYNQDLNGLNDLPSAFDLYSSANLVIKLTGYKANDIVTNQSIKIHLANDTLYKEGVYLANRETDYDPEPVGELNFDFNPAIDSILTIPLNEAFGKFLFERLTRTNIDSVYRDSLLLSLYHYAPLVIVPENNSEALFSANLREDTTGIYVNFDSESGASSTYRFDMVAGNITEPHYTNIVRDRSMSKLSALTNDYDSIVDPNRAYLNPLSGVYPKIDLTPITDFIDTSGDLIINRSELDLKHSVVDLGYIEPVEFIYFFFVQDNGKINASGTLSGNAVDKSILTEGSYLSSTDQVFLTFENDDEDNVYSGNTTFFTQILVDNKRSGTDYITKEMIVLSPRTMGLGQTSFISSEVKVRIYYSSLK